MADTDCSCLLHIGHGFRSRGSDEARFLDWAELLYGQRGTRRHRASVIVIDDSNGLTPRSAAMPEPQLHYRLDGADWTDRDRFERYRELLGRAVMKLDMEPYGCAITECRADQKLRALPGLMVGETIQAGIIGRRTAPLIDNDDIIFGMVVFGQRVASQRGRTAVVNPGEATIVTGGEIGHTIIQELESDITFRLPRHRLTPLAGDIDAAISRTIPRDNAALRLLFHYANAIHDINQFESAEAAALAATHITDLVALALGATRDGIELARPRGLRAGRMVALKHDIEQHLARPDLTVAALAARHGISTRYIRKLFEAENTSFTDFVVEQRLARAHRVLLDPCSDTPIGTIAYQCGFGDLSYFNRCFRRRYGLTPSDLRQQARGES
jgi:AraC-like DNA-binding protein